MTHLYDKQYFDEMRSYSSRWPHLKRMGKTIRKRHPKTVLDVGCGHGFLVNYLHGCGIDAIGIDSAEDAGSELKENTFKRASATALPFQDQSFDLVFSSDVLEHFSGEELERVISEMKRVGKHVVALVGTKPESRSTGIDTHRTVQSHEWWWRFLNERGVELM